MLDDGNSAAKMRVTKNVAARPRFLLPDGRPIRFAPDHPRVLLLQGPVGPFFSDLQAFLEEAGFEAWRVVFNAGDRVFAGKGRLIRFRGGRSAWARWIDAALASGAFGCVVLFGAERGIHRAARASAELYGIRVVSLEEGYLRPGFVTIEEGGNNAASPLGLRPLAVDLPEPPGRGAPLAHPGIMALYAAAYYIARGLWPGAGSPDLHHRPAPLLPEAALWMRNLWRRVAGGERSYRRIEWLLEHADRGYFLVPLQVARDANMGEAALGWTSERLVDEAVASFARSAPGEAHLVFKIHPMERGHTDMGSRVRRLAAEAGIAARVHVIDTGSLGLLARHAAGMITITSTSGLSALHHGTPLLVLGRALYAHPELAICAAGRPDFDRFWTCRPVAGQALRHGFLARLRREALKPGDFYSPNGRHLACRGVLEKLAEIEGLPRSRAVPSRDVA